MATDLLDQTRKIIVSGHIQILKLRYDAVFFSRQMMITRLYFLAR